MWRASSKVVRRGLLVVAAISGLGLALGPVTRHAESMLVLDRFARPDAASGGWSREIVTEDVSTPEQRARLYSPVGEPDGPGLVLVHGVHHAGIDEPRLVRFARAIAKSGVYVWTPELAALADYRVERGAVDRIGRAARQLSERVGRLAVGVMGFSFAGGLSLMASASEAHRDRIAFVVAIGAHDDLERVSTFFATGAIPTPRGNVTLHPHDYGPLVWVYAHVDDFFSPEDVPVAQESLRLWLHEKRDAAKQRVLDSSEPGRQRLSALFEGNIGAIAPALVESIGRHKGELDGVSPRGKLGSIRVPVFLLHGAGDTVIPPSETEWLASEIPSSWLREVLVSPAIVHVELGGSATTLDQWNVVHFVAEVLDAVEDEPK